MLENTNVKEQFTIADSATFDFGVRFFSPNDIACYEYNPNTKIETRLSSGTDYSIEEKTDYSSGAKVTLLGPLTSGNVLTIVRTVLPQQEVSLPNFGKIPSESLETQMDRTVAAVQQLHDQMDLVYQKPYGASGTPEQAIRDLVGSGGGGGTSTVIYSGGTADFASSAGGLLSSAKEDIVTSARNAAFIVEPTSSGYSATRGYITGNSAYAALTSFGITEGGVMMVNKIDKTLGSSLNDFGVPTASAVIDYVSSNGGGGGGTSTVIYSGGTAAYASSAGGLTDAAKSDLLGSAANDNYNGPFKVELLSGGTVYVHGPGTDGIAGRVYGQGFVSRLVAEQSFPFSHGSPHSSWIVVYGMEVLPGTSAYSSANGPYFVKIGQAIHSGSYHSVFAEIDSSYSSSMVLDPTMFCIPIANIYSSGAIVKIKQFQHGDIDAPGWGKQVGSGLSMTQGIPVLSSASIGGGIGGVNVVYAISSGGYSMDSPDRSYVPNVDGVYDFVSKYVGSHGGGGGGTSTVVYSGGTAQFASSAGGLTSAAASSAWVQSASYASSAGGLTEDASSSLASSIAQQIGSGGGGGAMVIPNYAHLEYGGYYASGHVLSSGSRYQTNEDGWLRISLHVFGNATGCFDVTIGNANIKLMQLNGSGTPGMTWILPVSSGTILSCGTPPTSTSVLMMFDGNMTLLD